MNIINYQGFYKDEDNTFPIIIEDSSYNLTAIINGLRFNSEDLIEWELDQGGVFNEDNLEVLSVNSITRREGYNLVTDYTLRDCSINFAIPQKVLSKQDVKEFEVDLHVQIELADEESTINLGLELPNKEKIEIQNIETFQKGLSELNKMINKTHILFNCFNCRYSSYSVRGVDIFGSLLCYKNYKNKFLQVTDKDSYGHVEQQGYDTVQETYYCDEFQLPNKEQFLYK